MRSLSFFLLACLIGSAAYAQDEGDGEETGGEETGGEETGSTGVGEESSDEETSTPPTIDTQIAPIEEQIVVNQRKPFLHTSRLELMPMAGATLNDPFLLHYAVGGALNYYFSDVLSVGIQGQKYFETSTGLDFDVIQLGALPALNRLDFYGGVHFNYAPIYGKFALFNQAVVGFETYVSLGAGITGNSILQPFAFAKAVKQEDLQFLCESATFGRVSEGGPVGDEFCDNPASFKNLQLALSPSAGAGVRFFLSDFISIVFDVKDYFFQETTLSDQQIFTQNVVFSVGTSFFFPSSFEYTTPR